MFRASDFKCREVINVVDGERLGFVYDMEIDSETGEIRSIVVPGKEKVSFFKKCKGMVIPWSCIKMFGEDTILVDVATNVQ